MSRLEGVLGAAAVVVVVGKMEEFWLEDRAAVDAAAAAVVAVVGVAVAGEGDGFGEGALMEAAAAAAVAGEGTEVALH